MSYGEPCLSSFEELVEHKVALTFSKDQVPENLQKYLRERYPVIDSVSNWPETVHFLAYRERFFGLYTSVISAMYRPEYVAIIRKRFPQHSMFLSEEGTISSGRSLRLLVFEIGEILVLLAPLLPREVSD